jgi:hypothetical protein
MNILVSSLVSAMEMRLVAIMTVKHINKKQRGWWRWIEHIDNNLMKLGGSLGNVAQKFKKLFIKTMNLKMD